MGVGSIITKTLAAGVVAAVVVVGVAVAGFVVIAKAQQAWTDALFGK